MERRNTSRFTARNTGGGGAKKYFKVWSQEYWVGLERRNTSRFAARNTGGDLEPEILQGLERGILGGVERRNTSRFRAHERVPTSGTHPRKLPPFLGLHIRFLADLLLGS